MTQESEEDDKYFRRDLRACELARSKERDDCVYRSNCLLEVAKERKWSRATCLPCEGCTRYRKRDPDAISPWRKDDYDFNEW